MANAIWKFTLQRCELTEFDKLRQKQNLCTDPDMGLKVYCYQ